MRKIMYAKFEALLADRGISVYKVSKDTGISYGVLGGWKVGRAQPKAETLQKIADYLDVPLGYFYGTEELPGEKSLDEQLKDISFALWGPIGDLSDDAKRDIIDYVNMK
ncbi:MAG: helix-turn-helix transcriptional regulator, partial [Clostridia bacterium]|nr:helix-turn-helix transcriptional regulator [Clostridia bacterium]